MPELAGLVPAYEFFLSIAIFFLRRLVAPGGPALCV